MPDVEELGIEGGWRGELTEEEGGKGWGDSPTAGPIKSSVRDEAIPRANQKIPIKHDVRLKYIDISPIQGTPFMDSGLGRFLRLWVELGAGTEGQGDRGQGDRGQGGKG